MGPTLNRTSAPRDGHKLWLVATLHLHGGYGYGYGNAATRRGYSVRLLRAATPRLPSVATPRGCNYPAATPWLLRAATPCGYSTPTPWLLSVATLCGYPPLCLLRAATPCGYPAV